MREQDWQDESGEYPSEAALERLRAWTFKDWADIEQALDFAASIWHWPDFASRELRPAEAEVCHAEPGDRFIRFATGGWSGNEDIIGAMEQNFYIMSRWRLSGNGGLHIFQYPEAPPMARPEGA